MSNQDIENENENIDNNEKKPIYLTDKIRKIEEDILNESTDSIVQPNEINPNSQLRMDILKAFGADLNTNTRDNIFIRK